MKPFFTLFILIISLCGEVVVDEGMCAPITSKPRSYNVCDVNIPLAGFSVRNLAVQMVSYGATDALSGSGMLKDLQASLKIEEDTRKLLAGITAHTAAQSAIGGQDLGRALLYNLTTQSAQFGATRMAGVIKGHYDPSGNKDLGLNYVTHKLAHGMSAATFGGLSAAVLGEDVGRSMLMAGCGAAVGEILGEGMMKFGLKEGEVIPLREYHTMRERVVFASQMGACLSTGMISTAMYGDDDAAAYGLTAETALARDLHLATTAADIAVRNNCLVPIALGALTAYGYYANTEEICTTYEEEGLGMAVVHGGVIYSVGKVSGVAAGKLVKGIKMLKGKMAQEMLRRKAHKKALSQPTAEVVLRHQAGDPRAFDRKARALQDLAERGKLVKVEGVVRDKSVTRGYRRQLIDAAKLRFGHQPDKIRNIRQHLRDLEADHLHELQLGGVDQLSYLAMLDKSVNRSVGAQIMHQVKDWPAGTRIVKIIVENKP